jgi:CRP-like cAMP-binding protein/membrane protein YdbS with pleckstrin-like domain
MPEIEPSELKRIPLFESLTWRLLTAVADLFKREEHPAGYVVCQRGKDPGDRAYFVRSGILSVRHVDEEGIMWETARLRPGDFFGQIALLLDQPQEDTIVVIEDAVLLALTRDSLYRLTDSRPALREALQAGMPKVRADELERIPLFARLSRKERRIIAEMFKPHEYQTGREICLQGQPGREAYFVKSGELRVTRVDAQGIVQPDVDRFGPGSFFGQTSLLVGEPRDATVEVVRTAIVLSLEQSEFDALLEEYPSILRKLQMRPEVAKRRRAPHFTWQYPDETVVVYLHKHNIILRQQLILPGLIFMVGLIGFLHGIIAGAIWALLLGVILILPALVFAGYRYIDQYNDYYVVTNKRIIQQERTPFGREQSSEVSLLNVQDIQLTKSGQLAWLFDFGDLIIDTAARHRLVIFRQIPDPEGTKEVIFEQKERAMSWARAEERAAIRNAMQTRFGLQSPPVRVAEPPSPPKARGFQPLAWLRTFFRILPPLHYEEGDTITWRKHWIALLRPILPPTGLIAGATIAAIILAYVSARINLSLAPILIGYGIFLVFPVLWWVWQFTDWQNDTYHVTATRIIDIEKRPFFGREERREADLERVQNITVTVPGPLARLLRYGSVVIETAGEEPFTFNLVKNPNEVRAEISRRVDARRRQLLHETARQHRDELLEWFSVYDQIHQTRAHKPEPSPQEEEESQAHAGT